MTERESIINDIQRFVGGQREYAERAADYLIADRKRIGEPLVKAFKNAQQETKLEYVAIHLRTGMVKALKLAGIEV